MFTLKLNLKLKHPRTIHSSNGKSYRLHPGSNTLSLEYDDYVALAKSLGMKVTEPMKSKQSEKKNVAEEPQVKEDKKCDSVHNELNNNVSPLEEIDDHAQNTNSESNDASSDNVDTSTSELDSSNDLDESKSSDDVDKETGSSEDRVDYNTLSYSELKAKYKEITGNSCKLKKVEIIAFLQDHDANV